MRATILPYATILTKVHRAYDGQGVDCGLSTVSEVFFLFLLPIYIFMFIQFNAKKKKILTRRKYCNRNTPHPQYSPLLTSGG